jgi:hypothetical protein
MACREGRAKFHEIWILSGDVCRGLLSGRKFFAKNRPRNGFLGMAIEIYSSRLSSASDSTRYRVFLFSRALSVFDVRHADRISREVIH